MPQIGEIKKGKEIELRSLSCDHIWLACETCGKERWVRVYKGKPKTIKCRHCSPRLVQDINGFIVNGGKIKNRQYIMIYLRYDNFFYPMAVKRKGEIGGYVFEHRLVMAKHLGRCLHVWEIVHHKNGIKDDNRIENLQLISDDRHKQITIMEKRIERLESRVTQLEAENMLLKAQMGESCYQL